jgi:hypothetical protein
VEFELQRMAVDFVRNGRKRGLESMAIINVNPMMKKVRPELYEDFKFVDFTRELYIEIFPVAEDMVKGIMWQEIFDEIYIQFEKKRETAMIASRVHKPMFEPEKALPIIEFSIKFPTHVKKKISDTEFDTFKHSKEVTKTAKIFVQPMMDENLQRGLLFGLLRNK